MAGSRRDLGVMRRGGFYNRHSAPQHEAAAFAAERLAQAARAAPLPEPGASLVIADYGAAQGGNSLAPMRAAIAEIRTRMPEPAPISVVHTDIPGDDFTALFTLLETSPESYLSGAAGVFPFAAGRSFYRQIFPPGSVSLGWSAIAAHWLSAAPAVIEGHIWPPRAEPTTRAAFARQSAADWRDFLRHRSVELRPRGRLVVIAGASDEKGDIAALGLMDMANAALRAMVAEGALAADEYRRMAIPTYNRTPAEFAAPFAAAENSGGLALEQGELRVLSDPIWAEYQRSGDREAFVAACGDFFDAAFSPSLFSALAEARTADQRQRLAADFGARLRALIAANPKAAVCDWRVFVMAIVKPG
jgi:hypothetical protein